ncbi:probable lipoprotein [Cronobacter sakazakii 680]|nr:probable lipoprotein [Cronobacter sakazakii 680]
MLNSVRIFQPVSRRSLHSIKLRRRTMNKLAAVVSACMMTFALSACSGPNYVMHTNDGRSIVTDGKPKTDDDTGMIKYKDANGNQQQINRTDVKEMVALEK